MTDQARQPPLVGIGVPVRNGGAFLAGMLGELCAQTYDNLDIVISDNQSTDDTAAIAAHFAARDPRVRFYRQDRLLTATQNFRHVFDATRGDYFLWAAHDDRHAENYVETLVAAALARPAAALVFSDSATFRDHAAFRPEPFDDRCSFDQAVTRAERLRRLLTLRPYNFYGLHRRDVLAGTVWPDIDHGWDRVVLAYLSGLGTFDHVGGTCFYYYRPADEATKSLQRRARDNFQRDLRPFPNLRLCWQMAGAARRGGSLPRNGPGHVADFLRLYLPVKLLPHIRSTLFRIAPPALRNLWQRCKGR